VFFISQEIGWTDSLQNDPITRRAER